MQKSHHRTDPMVCLWPDKRSIESDEKRTAKESQLTPPYHRAMFYSVDGGDYLAADRFTNYASC
ncbi:MAG TPA: hypothetical protein VEF04_12935, partial [Blastocatellia bacterium]|nr:hypothetical protein [Blastocatellia bacterium]